MKNQKIALVTGAAKRVGRAIAIGLAKDGWDVAIHYGNSKDAAEQTVKDILATGQRGVALQADLSKEDEANQLIARCVESLGLPTCLVNNASLFQYDVASSFSYAALDRHMLTNVAAPLILSRDLYRLHAKNRAQDAVGPSGVVINLLDQKLANLNPDFLSYTLSKAALHSATTLLAQSFAPNLRVVGVAPGITMVSGDQSEDGFVKAHSMTPLGKSSTPDDIAGAVIYLANSNAVTGTTLYVDGGQHLLSTDRDVMFLTE
ncbi:MAG: SDR family oxidoreductase [Polynucleobacter victoriensis]|jgi:NAD(P)-dependent dehydrogenase (short-subunit alcohol dehydrogenase family)|uniref:NAD(P)-dependent dehydrogenase, short-chain alcohol dehydrogenase family n=1 Tax=Polynucleobacter victoriensis TaxID=2049319 RepID=A0A212TD17_9BURK|nr:SDR family oxidoreductase [Polynucleobacter victoriensis]SNC63912.1 NAD(P)-dependent dehydrogenase, short-chain alcohol dehydrogenase family [Polynucleobacter victoriensis]